jgi:Phage integrase family
LTQPILVRFQGPEPFPARLMVGRKILNLEIGVRFPGWEPMHDRILWELYCSEFGAHFAVRAGRKRIITLDDLRKKYPGGLAGFSGGRGLVRSDNRDRVVFGFHNFRHSLASFLVRIKTDPKTVQTLLRHSDVKLTLQFYTHSVSDDRMAASGAMLTAIFWHAWKQSGLKAD